MRIIAGKHRGRPILAPEGHDVTRPITDRVKTSLFDRLAAADRLEGAVALDLFAGTGSLGLECLSRGAAHVVFVERDRSALALLKKNLEIFAHVPDARVANVDALGMGVLDLPRPGPYSLVFLDPPYSMMDDENQRQRVEEQGQRLAAVCAADAMLVLRTSERITASPISNWSPPTTYGYGSMLLHLYTRAE